MTRVRLDSARSVFDLFLPFFLVYRTCELVVKNRYENVLLLRVRSGRCDLTAYRHVTVAFYYTFCEFFSCQCDNVVMSESFGNTKCVLRLKLRVRSTGESSALVFFYEIGPVFARPHCPQERVADDIFLFFFFRNTVLDT